MNNLWRPKDIITIGIKMNLKHANIVVPVCFNSQLLESSEMTALTKKFPSSDLPAGKSVRECLDY